MHGVHQPLDLDLILPHYRARNQPIDHRMSMFVANDHQPIKLKVVRSNLICEILSHPNRYPSTKQCRNFPRSKFYLEVQAESSDVTIWLPSDFKGHIHHTGKPRFSAGFVNRILANVHLNESDVDEFCGEDDVVVVTRGRITFRMWDVQTCRPENPHKESLRRIFGCSRKAPETTIDWDFLLKD